MKAPSSGVDSTQAILNSADELSERFGAAMLAAAAGDALGWPHEFNNRRIDRRPSSRRGVFEHWMRRWGSRFAACEEPIGAGEYSDDTQLLIATARSLRDSIDLWVDQLCYEELPLFLVYERGGGGATKRAAASWADRIPPWTRRPIASTSPGASSANRRDDPVAEYFNAGGNGAAMRIMPHTFVSGSDPYHLRGEIIRNAVLTHGHPNAIVGALIYGAACSQAAEKTGTWEQGELLDLVCRMEQIWIKTPSEKEVSRDWFISARDMTGGRYLGLWAEAVEEAREGFTTIRQALVNPALTDDTEVLRSIGAFDRKRTGSGLVAALVAIYLATRYASAPRAGVLTAAYAVGADTDTLASMTGGLFGAMLGAEWIPSDWYSVQDANFLAKLAIATARSWQRKTDRAHLPVTKRRDFSWLPVLTRRSVLEKLRKGQLEFQLGSLGLTKFSPPESLRPATKRAECARIGGRTQEGQTIYVLQIDREKDVALQKGTAISRVSGETTPAGRSTRDTAVGKDQNRRGQAISATRTVPAVRRSAQETIPFEDGEGISSTNSNRVLLEGANHATHDLERLLIEAGDSITGRQIVQALQASLVSLVRLIPIQARLSSTPTAELDEWLKESVQKAEQLGLSGPAARVITRLAWRLAVGSTGNKPSSS